MSAAWYCRIRGQQVGPLSPVELKALAASGELALESLVRQGPAGQWVKASRVKGLFSATPQRASPGGGSRGNLPEGLDDLLPLPASPASLPPMGSLAAGRRAGLPDDLLAGLPALSGDVLPVGQSVPMGLPVGMRLPVGAPTHGAASEAGPTAGRRSAANEDQGFSKARVMGVAIVAIFFGFAGVCTLTIRSVRAELSIIPVVLGTAGTIMGLRAVTLGSRKDSMSLGLSLVAMVLGLVAAGTGLYQMHPSDWASLNQQMRDAAKGAPERPPAPAAPLPKTTVEIRPQGEDKLAPGGRGAEVKAATTEQPKVEGRGN